jgi:hypothetical protein
VALGLLTGCGPAERSSGSGLPVVNVVRWTQLAAPGLPPRVTWAQVKSVLTDCAMCHRSGGGAQGRLLFGSPQMLPADDPYDYASTLLHVDFSAPANSALLMKALQDRCVHGGGARLAAGSAGHLLLLEWIRQGCPYQ